MVALRDGQVRVIMRGAWASSIRSMRLKAVDAKFRASRFLLIDSHAHGAQ
jgi:hypothetical protein